MTSNERIIEILFKLLTAKKMTIHSLTEEYNVTLRTIQRDLATIKKLAHHFSYELVKNSYTNDISLKNPNKLVFEDTLAIAKVLLASRAFSKNEMTQLLNNLLLLNPDGDDQSIANSIKNELTFYYPLSHKKDLLNDIKLVDAYISEKKILRTTYKKNDGVITKRNVLPVSIFFSDYYFYVICYEPDKERYINLRLDRFLSIKQTQESISIPYSKRIEEKNLREQMILMHYGKKITFTFKFRGIVEAALDKFPNSKVIKTLEDGSVLIKAEAYDKGAMMWLLSQGSLATVISPPSFVEEIRLEIFKMVKEYE